MKKFDATTWKNEIRASLPEFEKKLADAEKAFEEARQIWRQSGYSDACYQQYRETDRARHLAEKALENARLLALDQLYCNQHFYTDVEAWEVIGYVSEKCLIIREMKAQLKPEARKELHDSFVLGGFCGHFNNDLQEWEIVPDPDGHVIRVRLHKNGNYYAAHEKGTTFVLSEKPRKYYDYNF